MSSQVQPPDSPRFDGVRDRFSWGRIASPRMLTFGMVLALVLVVMSTMPPERRASGDATKAAHHVRLSAISVADAVGSRGSLTFTREGDPSTLEDYE